MANDDTFHFTNCTPQHHEFNAGSTLWAGLEDYVLNNADTADLAVSVLTGPVLADDDDAVPRRAAAAPVLEGRRDGQAGRRAVGHRLPAQPGGAARRICEAEEEFSYGAYRTFQVPVRRIAALTGLGLDPHIAADPLERIEATPLPRELIRREDLILVAWMHLSTDGCLSADRRSRRRALWQVWRCGSRMNARAAGLRSSCSPASG